MRLLHWNRDRKLLGGSGAQVWGVEMTYRSWQRYEPAPYCSWLFLSQLSPISCWHFSFLDCKFVIKACLSLLTQRYRFKFPRVPARLETGRGSQRLLANYTVNFQEAQMHVRYIQRKLKSMYLTYRCLREAKQKCKLLVHSKGWILGDGT